MEIVKNSAQAQKKIIVLNGSPQRDKSVTLVLARNFVKGIQRVVPSECEYINISDINMKPCLGCLSCWGRTEGSCVIKDDDIASIKQKILDSDYVIESFPLYFFGMPGIMKVFTDRMLSMMNTYAGQKNPDDGKSFHGLRYPDANRRFVVISSCAYSDSTAVYDALKMQYDCICGKDKYIPITVPQLKTTLDSAKGARLEKYLKKFEDAGAVLAQQGELSREILDDLAKPPFTKETYTLLLSKYWEFQRAGGKND